MQVKVRDMIFEVVISKHFEAYVKDTKKIGCMSVLCNDGLECSKCPFEDGQEKVIEIIE